MFSSAVLSLVELYNLTKQKSII